MLGGKWKNNLHYFILPFPWLDKGRHEINKSKRNKIHVPIWPIVPLEFVMYKTQLKYHARRKCSFYINFVHKRIYYYVRDELVKNDRLTAGSYFSGKYQRKHVYNYQALPGKSFSHFIRRCHFIFREGESWPFHILKVWRINLFPDNQSNFMIKS